MIFFFPVRLSLALQFKIFVVVNQKGYLLLKGSLLENLVKVFVSFGFATLACKCTEKNREARELLPSGAF